jgi:hypothetical protein
MTRMLKEFSVGEAAIKFITTIHNTTSMFSWGELSGNDKL